MTGEGRSGARHAAACVVFSWMAIECFINDMMADFVALPPEMFNVHERGLLQERRVEFSDSGTRPGEFRLTNRRQFWRLDDKILFLVARLGKGTRLDKGSRLWQKFEILKDKRDLLTHPRKDEMVQVSLDEARDALAVAKDIIQVVAKQVWKKEIEL